MKTSKYNLWELLHWKLSCMVVILFCYFLTKGLPKKTHLEILNFLTALEVINIINEGFNVSLCSLFEGTTNSLLNTTQCKYIHILSTQVAKHVCAVVMNFMTLKATQSLDDSKALAETLHFDTTFGLVSVYHQFFFIVETIL